MTDRYIFYDVDGKNLKVPVERQKEFEERLPDAKMMLTFDGKNHKIPISQISSVVDRIGADNLTYSVFDEKKEYVPSLSTNKLYSFDEPKDSLASFPTTPNTNGYEDRPNVGETFLKGIGAGLVRAGKAGLDLGNLAFKTSTIGYPIDLIRRAINKEHGNMDEELQDTSNPITRASIKLGEVADRLSREADPTGGEKGFVDLISEGKYGMAFQKALGSGLESLPMMISASTGVGALIYGAGMAASTYSDETRENPDIPSWKRGVNALGSAALEMAVERIGGPLKNVFGKAGGELTDEMAKELLENVAKEGTESIAKRIAKGLKNIGKEGLEEGGEELLTSFGNDALGEALDIIDGDKDYGIRAQWERIKEENPDASVGDFAKTKAKEYLDSFIGGALSGMQISSAAGAINYAVKNEDIAKLEINKSRELGAALNYGDMYDTDEVVNESIDKVGQSFINKDGEQTLSREFILSLSSDQAYELARREDVPAEQRSAFYGLAKAKALQEGLNSKLDQRLNEEIEADRTIINNASENGKILTADYGGKLVYVKGGAINNNRTTLPNGGDGPIIVIDSVTGEQQTVNTKDLGASEYLDTDKLISLHERSFRDSEGKLREEARNTMSSRAKTKAVLPYARKKILIDVGNGITEVFVEKISDNGEVMIKGKKGDLGGQSILTMDASTFYDSIYRDDDGNPVVTEVEQENEEVTEPTEETPETELTGEDDFRDYTGNILINGVPVNVEVTAQDNPSNTITYRYTDENGYVKTGSTTIGEFKTAVQQAEEYASTQIEAPEPVVNETAPVTEEPAPATPVDIDWDALFDNDTEAFFTELQKQFGDDTLDILNEFVSAAQEELDSLNKKKKSSNPNDIIATRNQRAALQRRIDAYNQMIARLTPASETPAVEPTETPTDVLTEAIDETPVEPIVAAPAPQPAPAEPIQTENGFIVVDKVITNPEVIEMPNTPEGDANRIFIGEYNGKWTYGAEALMDNGSWGKTPEMRIENARYDTREDAIKGAISFLENQWRNKRKDAGSTALDSFIQYVRDTYLPSETPAQATPIVESEPVASPAEMAGIVPTAPTPVSDPIREAQKREKSLATQLKRIGISREQKQDMAFNAGKAVADMFATREEYDAYAENATDFGEFNEYFDMGVDASFANRSQSTGNSPVNSVPLETEPNGEENGETAKNLPGEVREGYTNTNGNEPNNDEKAEDSFEESGEGSEEVSGSGNNQSRLVSDKYPVRNGDITRQTLADTFGLNSVSPALNQDVLNSIYDFMMEMSKMLGISPKSIGHGATLGVKTLGDNSNSRAQYSFKLRSDGTIIEPYLRFKNAKLSSIAHEWFHSLDQALSYYETGRGKRSATNVISGEFTGRQETLDAIKGIIKAINNSGHKERLKKELWYDKSYLRYSLRKDEMSARAFEEYIRMKFADAGIEIEGLSENATNHPTPEEMVVIAPAFDNLFKVLQEKDGKKPGTSVLYHIGEIMDEDSDAKKLATEAVFMSLDEGGREVEILSDEQTEQYLNMIGADTETQFSVDTDKPIFLSNAAIAVAGIKQEKATPEQWLKMIEKAGGLKAGEDKWMGLSDWLKESDKKTLSKQEVLDFINDNTIRIEEQQYVADIDYSEDEQAQIDAINEEFIALRKESEEAGEWIHDAAEIAYQVMADKYGDYFTIGFGVNMGELYVSNLEAASSITGIEPRSERLINDTRLEYTTDGLDNKKEIALIVPTIDSWNSHDEIHFGDAGDGRAIAWIRFGEARTYAKEYADFYDFQGKMQKKYFPDRAIQALGGSDLDALTEEERAEFERLREIARNIPAKNRTNRRVLVIDEIQSKRHQEGREKGYADERIVEINKRLDVLAGKMYVSALSQEEYEERESLREELNSIPVVAAHRNAEYDMRDYERLTPQSEFSEERYQELKAIYDKTGEALMRAQRGVPDAPFEKNWSELAMKRMLRYAAENGYDAVAWTKGEQQAERYSMSNVVDSILMDGDWYDSGSIKPEEKTIRNVVIAMRAGDNQYYAINKKGILINGEYEGKHLSELVGKELAEKLINAKPYERISGDGLKIGGEGMKGFYDKMLPAFMNKYGKKWGVKVSDITLPHVEEAGRVMHSVPVTEAMKESVTEGQPMFFKTPNGTVYGWTDGKKIYLTKAGINPNTPIHEYTHLWAKAMMLRNPKGWNSVKQLLKNTPVWNEVMNDANYSNIHSNEDLVASEALSRISGSENAAKLEQMAQQMIDEAKGTMRKAEARGLIQNIKDALNKFWNWVGTELFGIEKFESVEQVTDRVLWDLVNKTDLGELSEGQVETQIVTDTSEWQKENDEILSRSGDVTPEDIRNEKVSIKEKAIADGTFMKAPNGEPTNLTEDQWLIVRTESFKNWFGDWENDPKNSSKVVDKNGEPQVVYHGSPYGAITEFDRRGHSVSGLREFGTYFSTSKKLAQLYAYARQQAKGDIEKYETEKYRLDAIIFNNETPARVALDAFDELDRLEESQKPKVYEVFLNIREPKVFDAERSNGWDGWHKLKQDVGYDVKSGVEAIEAIAGHNSAARMKDKYDGIIAQNMADVHSEATEDLMGDVFLVFDETPANIKSATSNIGTFDPENPDIRYRRSTPVGFHQLEVDNFLSKYNPDCEVTVYPVNEKTAKMFGYTLEQLNDIHGLYLPSYDFIAIFAMEDITDGQEIEETLFHESIHKLVQFSANEYMVNAGKWMFDNASTEEMLSDYKKKIEENYKGKPNVVKHEEMLTHVLSGAMRHGGTEALMSIVPSDSKKIINEILNAIRYESKAESERRIRETLSQSSVAEDVSESGSENAGKSSKLGYAGATGRPENAESGRRVTVENQNAAVNLHTGETRNGIIERAVSEEAQKLGVNVTFAKRSEMAKGHETDKGYYNTKTGEIVICPENNASIADAIQTILHEAVAHKGLRQLMGDRFDEFISRVYDSLDDETKAKVDKLAEDNYNGNKAVAMEEYMASLAENENFAENSVWDKIKSIFEKIINSILDRNDIKIGDNELRYILRASYANMVNPRNMDTIEGWAKDTNMREEYKINKSTPELLSRTGIDPTEVARESAKTTYDRVVGDNWQEFQRQFQDAMQPVRIAIDAIQQETGNIPIEDYENYILIQNHASSRSRVEIDEFARKYYSPIIKQINGIIDAMLEARGFNIHNKTQRSKAYQELKNYLIAKHGLERNEYYQTHKQRLLNKKEKEEAIREIEDNYSAELARIASTYRGTERANQENIAKQRYESELAGVDSMTTFDVRDYAGLTALYGLDPKEFELAESMARETVASFEAGVDTYELWRAINAATDKTLRHSYECGMLSRQQYEDIKNMFSFYIPLRGFDETTAEDVYSYARFESNRFNPAVQTAKGRTSLADDPIAIIMNMAESEIAQGNKNRAKQALYNFILNRPVVDENGNQSQNSLMQIESVWYVKNVDAQGNETYTIAAPDHANGETYEDFEARMQTLANNDMAFKSKKGKVDVGMRFQKQMDRNSHYIYLKVNGVDKAIYINGDPKAADAVNGTYQQKKQFGEDKMRTLNRLISSTFTNYSLEFTARNYFRDMFYSHINIGVRESDPAYRKKFRQNWRHNNLGTMMKMLTAYRAGEFDGRPLTEDEAAFVEFMKNGGQTGYTLINSVENHKRDLERAIKNMQKGIEHGGVKDSTIFKYTLGGVELLNEASELVTRFAAFKTSRDMGRGVETSINDAKEVTVNFNTKGAQDGAGWMGAVARYFGWSKFFFNASVQGVQNLKAMSKANTLKFCGVVGGVAAAGFFMPILSSVISEILGGDDDDENFYWNIPEYERQNNLCIPVGSRYVKIPLPIGFREVYAIGDMVAAMLDDKKFDRDISQIGTDIANKIASVILPINPLESAANGLDLWQTGAYTILPSGAQFAIQNMTNIDWKGAPLQKEYTWNKDDPQWMKAFNSNPDWLTGLSRWCNEHINIDGDFDGMDWSPEKIDNTLSNLFGGIYSLLKKSGKTISMIWNEENRNLSNVPLTGVVLGSSIDNDDRFIESAYYEMNDYYDANVNSIKRTGKAFGYSLEEIFEKQPGAHQPKMQKIYSNDNFDFMQEWYKGDKALESLKGKINRLEKKAAGMDNPTVDLLEEIANLKNEYEADRRDFVNDMLELD